MMPESPCGTSSGSRLSLLATALQTSADRGIEEVLCALLIDELSQHGADLSRIPELTAKKKGAVLADEVAALAPAYAAYAETGHGPVMLQALESLADRVLQESCGIERLHLLEQIWSSSRFSLKTYGYLRTCLLDISLDDILRAYPEEDIPADDLFTWLALAQVALRGGERDEALSMLTLLNERAPSNPFVQELLANAFIAGADFASADRLYRALGKDYIWPAGLIRLADETIGPDLDSAVWDESPERFSWIPCKAAGRADTVFVIGVDDRYARRYLPDLAESLERIHTSGPWLLHVHLVNPSQETLDWIAARQDAGLPLAATVENVTYRETEIVGAGRVVEMRTYYACARFRVLPHLLDRYAKPLWVIDADMRALRPVRALLDEAGYSEGAFDLGIVPLDERARCLTEYVWLSLSYYAPSKATRRFVRALARYLNRQLANDLWGWGLDQAAFFAVLAWFERHDPDLRVARLPSRFIADNDVQLPEACFTSRVASLE